MKKIVTVALIGLFCASISFINGCSTVNGFGKEVFKEDGEIQRAGS
jgi:hypothetical protein